MSPFTTAGIRARSAPRRSSSSSRTSRCKRRSARPGASLPFALARKYPEAGTRWGWQYLFPAAGLCRDPYTGCPVRHHLDEKIIQRAVQGAVRKAELTQPASCHTLRH
jgi:integrase